MKMRSVVLSLCLAGFVLPGLAQAGSAPAAVSAKSPALPPGPVPPGPVPPAIGAAKKVFLSTEGSDGGLFPHPFSGTESRAYDQLYAALQQWGRYELVGNPADADLVFDIELLSPKGPQGANKVTGASDPLPEVRLAIYDRPTHYVLWSMTEQIEPANLQRTHDRNFDQAMEALMADLKSVAEANQAKP